MIDNMSEKAATIPGYAWAIVIREANNQDRCWCGGDKGHVGWLDCAEAEARKIGSRDVR